MDQLKDYMHIPIVLFCCWIVVTILKVILNRFLKKRSTFLKIDPTNFTFLRNALSFILYSIALVIIFILSPGLKGIGATLFASAGIVAAIVGFASKEAFANIISGIFIIIFKPFRVDDMLQFESGERGKVEDITLRHTVICDLNNKRIIVPNSTMSSQSIVNFDISDKRILFHYKINISFESDVDKAISLIKNFLEARKEVLEWRRNEADAPRKSRVRIRVTELFDSGMTLRADYWCEDYETAFSIMCRLNKELLVKFKENGIEIPYPHRTIVYKDRKPEVIEEGKQ